MTLCTYTTDVEQALTDDFLEGRGKLDLSRFRQGIDQRDLLGSESPDADIVRELSRHAVARQFESSSELDTWLAPRLHAALRLPPRVAADPDLWRWISIELMADYIHERHAKDGRVIAWRFTGSDRLRNAAARLWWIAELTRNGPDYSMVRSALSRVRVAEFALELKYSWFRPAAIAFVRVANGLDGGEPLKDLKGVSTSLQGLSKMANAYLTLKPLEAIGLAPAVTEDYDLEWRRHQPTFNELVADDLPKGPKDGIANPVAIEHIERWFRAILAEC